MPCHPVLEELLAYARYEPETGQFIRLRNTASNARAGEQIGTINSRGYRVVRLGKKTYRANRLAWLWMNGEWPLGFVDHANGNRADDRWENLRLASCAENSANARLRRDNSSGFKGVKHLRGRWQARIGRGGTGLHLGTFDTPEEAHAAYVRAAKALYGKFARGS